MLFMKFSFLIDKNLSSNLSEKLKEKYPLMRVGTIQTAHGKIDTPAYVSVGTKATVKGLTPDMIRETGAQVVLANTYHLYLQPGHDLVSRVGGLGKFMSWSGPTMTDSGGFQAFSLGAALGKNITKLVKGKDAEEILPEITDTKRKLYGKDIPEEAMKPAAIDANGVMFRSIIDGSAHYFTPQKSIEIQHALGADIIIAFDECTSPHEPLRYQQEALDRTHRWAKSCLEYHHLHHIQKPDEISYKPEYEQALYAVVQGGRHEELRKESAEVLKNMLIKSEETDKNLSGNGENGEGKDGGGLSAGKSREIGFDGFAIGGSFAKEDMSTSVKWVNEILPPEKPRHLLGIGEPLDLFMAIENGCDTFDCVLPTRNGRTGTLFTSNGKINIANSQYREDLSILDEDFICPSLAGYTKAYVSHLFHAKEMMGPIIASQHNLYFLIELTKRIRASIIDGTYEEFKNNFLSKYKV